jgi:hypothetical protein
MSHLELGDACHRMLLRFAQGRRQWHNRLYPPSLDVAFDHHEIVMARRGRELKAGWYSALHHSRQGRCHIVLSGASVATIERPEWLGSHYSIWVNGSPELAFRVGILPELYVVSDPTFVRRCPDVFRRYAAGARRHLISFAVAAEVLRAASGCDGCYLYDNWRTPFRRARFGAESDETETRPMGRNQIREGRSVVLTALRAAMALGFSEILVFGLDLGGGGRFYQERAPQPTTLLDDRGVVLRELAEVADEAEQRGITILNCSPDSAVGDDIFPRYDPNRLIHVG